MIIQKGTGASGGIAIGPIRYYKGNANRAERAAITDERAELNRLEQARVRTVDHLNRVYEKSRAELGEENASIFQIHAMMLEDPDYLEGIVSLIETERVNAEYAVEATGERFARRFAEMDDDYMRQRAADVRDISRSLVQELSGARPAGLDAVEGRVVLAADDLMPSETVQLDKSKVLAFVTRGGSRVSHSAILARTMGIPAVVGLGDAYDLLPAAGEVIVDGYAGEVIASPDEAARAAYTARMDRLVQERGRLRELRGKPSITLDGARVEVNANIGHPGDLDLVLENDAEGIGLFRSEFLYMESEAQPTEEEQFDAYRTVLERMQGKRVIVRTLDVGADKHIPYLQLPPEDNPAMGFRAVRVCLERPELFRTQLRALLRASAFGRLGIMVPMITSVEEVLRTKAILSEEEERLRQAGTAVSHYEFGIMIETPAAAMISDLLARHVDFFSIGTNDLTQYALAVDRMNHAIGALYDPGHPGVLRLMRLTVENGRKHGVWTGVCGESAADVRLIPTFLAMGITELSVAASSVLEVRGCVRGLDLGACAQSALERLSPQ